MKKKTIAISMTAALIIGNSSFVALAADKGKDSIVSIVESSNTKDKNAIVEEEILRSKMTATHTSAQPGEGADKVLDGNPDTMWHTPWDKGAQLPQGITVNLGGKALVNTIKVSPRKSQSNGIITKYEIHAINDGRETLISSGKWSDNNTTKIVSLDKPVEADAIKITALEGGGGFASISEVNIYKQVKEANKIESYENIRIDSNSKVVDISDKIDELKNLEEGTIVARFKGSNKNLASLIGISNKNRYSSHFHLYKSGAKVGVEIRNESTGLNKHISGDSVLNEGFNTIAFKVEKDKSYSLYLNGKLIKKEETNDTKFLSDIAGINSAFIGKTPRLSGNQYIFNGDIDFIDIYNEAISDNYLVKKTSETNIPSEDEYLPENAYKSEKQDLFKPGDLNSNAYRIPALYTTKAGTVLASIDARKPHGGDAPNNIDTAIRRSKDGGKTWEESKIILDYPDKASAIDTAIVQDDETGRIFLLVTHFPSGYGFNEAKPGSGYKEIDGQKYLLLRDANNNEYTIREEGKVYDRNGIVTEYTLDEDQNLHKNGNKVDNVLTSTSPLKVMGTSFLSLIYSDDDGKTWSKPIDLNKDVKADWMRFLGTGPGRGHQIENGKYTGRLVFPVYLTNASGFQSSAVIYSDDKGKTWEIGETATDGRDMGNGQVGNAQTQTSGNQLTECQVVEMPNGQLKLFMRNTGNYVRIATSFDGGATWEDDVVEDTNIREPYCQLSVINYSQKIDGKDALIFSNPDAEPRNRIDGTVRIGLISESGTYENGEPKYDIEWKYKKLVKPGYFAYSCLTELQNGNIGLFYEGTDVREMSYTEMNLDYLKFNVEKDTTPAKLEKVSIVDQRESYKPGDELKVSLTFNQSVSIMGNRRITVKVGNKEVELNMNGYNGANEATFVGAIPSDIEVGNYNLVIKPNLSMEIINVLNKVTTINQDIEISPSINIRK
ncbi:sialidase domain-containing protein [[Clostridium] dakarense]|uniref:sialidase domain-containing protein n=1 Tax=Faecalimicrobium dakarense TaxID=1301100 RepID=UPI0004B7DCB8|nr:sialidase domain-containing protein [[Clostridium] dakarense]